MPTIRHDGSALYYEEYGAGPPLVFVHGQAGNTLVWWQQIPAFAPDYRCIVLDLPGWGRSLDARPGSGPRLPDIVAALGRVLDAAGVGTCAIVAHSLGGVVANAFCLAHPERVRAAVLNGSTGGVVPPSMQALKGEIDRGAGALTEAWRAGHGPHPGVSARQYREQPALARLYEMIAGLNRLYEMIAGLNRPDTLDPTRIPTMDRLAVPAHTLFLFPLRRRGPVLPAGLRRGGRRRAAGEHGRGDPREWAFPLLRARGSVQHDRAPLPRRPLWGIA